MDFEKILAYMSPIFMWLSSGPVGIIAGIIGLGGILTTVLVMVRSFSRKLEEANYQNTLNDNARLAGEVSEELSRAAKRNTQSIDEIAKIEKARLRELENKSKNERPI
jgi:hypothetical protein